MKNILFYSLLVISVQAGERNVLVEMFTNSHCGNCPAAHAQIKSYVSSSQNASRIRYIYYHTLFPYSDDPLAQANTSEPVARIDYYGLSHVTPSTIFDGTNQGTSYSSWPTNLDDRFSVESPIDITMTGSRNRTMVSIKVALTKIGTIDKTDLVVHAAAVEHVTYVGRNGVSPQDFVMRKMLTGSGQSFQFDDEDSASVTISGEMENVSDIAKSGVVVFVQSISSKEIYQSEYITASVLTGISDNQTVPLNFSLHQNYPNPFNPSTVIEYDIQSESKVSLKVYNVLGKEVAILVDKIQPAGKYSKKFTATGLTTGIYFYRLKSGERTLIKRMLLLQ